MRCIDSDVLLDKVIEQYCKDCNKRKAIKSGKWRFVYEIGDAPCRACGVGDVMDEIEDAPTIEPERKPGHWIIYTISMLDGEDCKCSKCGQTSCMPHWNFCPNCGEKMEGCEQDGQT